MCESLLSMVICSLLQHGHCILDWSKSWFSLCYSAYFVLYNIVCEEWLILYNVSLVCVVTLLLCSSSSLEHSL